MKISIYSGLFKLNIVFIITIIIYSNGVDTMSRSLFLINGNICGAKIRLGRAMQKPPMTQDDLAKKIQLMGMDMTPLIISRIEKNKRHVCDAELIMISKALNLSVEWLCSEE